MTIGILTNASAAVPLSEEAVVHLIQKNHTVLIEGRVDDARLRRYLNRGAYIIDVAGELLDRAQLIIKSAPLTLQEIDYVHGSDKILFTPLNYRDKKIIEKLLTGTLSVINVQELRKPKGAAISKIFPKLFLGFISELADFGIKALVEDEALRRALSLMGGKVYNQKLAKLYQYRCYEF